MVAACAGFPVAVEGMRELRESRIKSGGGSVLSLGPGFQLSLVTLF